MTLKKSSNITRIMHISSHLFIFKRTFIPFYTVYKMAGGRGRMTYTNTLYSEDNKAQKQTTEEENRNSV